MTMSLKKILEHFEMTEQEFLDMTDDQWEERTKPILEKLEEEDHNDFKLLKIIVINLEKQAERKKLVDDELAKEIMAKPKTLSMETPNTNQHKTRTEEIKAAQDPVNAAVAQSGEVAFNYVIKGENKAEIQKNREDLFKAYDTYVSTKKPNLSAEDKEKYKPEIFIFKTWAELEKSDKLFQDTKDNYKDMKFPLEMTILKFDSPDEGKAFMENQGKSYLTKPPAPKPAAEKKEKDDEKVDSDKTKDPDTAPESTAPRL